MAPSLRVFNERDSDLKEKITFAIRQIETQRNELDQLRFRLDERRRTIFNSTVKAFEQSDEMRARLLANEHYELQKITGIVNASELALLHIVVRLETLRDVGDVMYVLASAFKAVKKIGKSISEVTPNLEKTAEEINQAFSGILSELGILTPSVSIALTDTPQEIFDKAQQLISERTSELGELPKAIQQGNQSEGVSVFEKTKRIALLASSDEEQSEHFDADDVNFNPVLFTHPNSSKIDPETAIRKYLRESGSRTIDVMQASAKFNLPVDKVEQSYISLLSDSTSKDANYCAENDNQSHVNREKDRAERSEK